MTSKEVEANRRSWYCLHIAFCRTMTRASRTVLVFFGPLEVSMRAGYLHNPKEIGFLAALARPNRRGQSPASEAR